MPPVDPHHAVGSRAFDLGRRSPDVATRLAALGGVIGPVAFVGAWAVGSTVAPGYSNIDDAISRLAAIGADTRPLMTAGFVAFGAGVPLFAIALRRVIGGVSWISAAATGLATLAVAAIPLDRSSTADTWHGVAAAIGYITLAATPLLAVGPLLERGQRGLAGLGVVSAAVSATSLLLSATRLPNGLFQRIGLTAGDIWIVAAALAIVSGRLRPDPFHRPRRGRRSPVSAAPDSRRSG